MDSAMIKIENLRKTFNEEEVLKGITCEFTRGGTHAVIGNSGAGKSVFFKCICGFIEPTGGHISEDIKLLADKVWEMDAGQLVRIE